MVIKDIVNTSLKIPYDQVWKFYNSLDDSTQKIKKLFLNCGKYFSAEVSYLLISQFDLIELVELFDELRESGNTSLLVSLLTKWAAFDEYKKIHEVFQNLLWELFLIHFDLFSQEEFQKRSFRYL